MYLHTPNSEPHKGTYVIFVYVLHKTTNTGACIYIPNGKAMYIQYLYRLHMMCVCISYIKVLMSLILLVALSRAKKWRERTLRLDDGISAAFI